MDDIAHDLETLHTVDGVKNKPPTLSIHEKRPPVTKDETSQEIAVDDDADEHLTLSLKGDDGVETPRVNVFVNQVEISQKDDEDEDDESLR